MANSLPVTKVVLIESSKPILYLSNTQLKLFNLTVNSKINLRAGSSICEVQVTQSLNGNFISSDILKKLGLPNLKNFLVKIETDNTLQLGPIIGLLVIRGKKRRLPPYSAQNKLLHAFLRYCRKQNYIGYVFFPENLDLNERKVKGLFLDQNPDGTVFWKNHEFPLPDVVYDRILHRSLERKLSSQQVKSFFMKERLITYFNPKFLDKWETHSILTSEPSLCQYLPETLAFDNTLILTEVLKKYETIYVKPIHGSLGRGIFKITRCPEGYCFQYRQGKRTFSKVFNNIDELAVSLQTSIKNRAYVVQQGLDLLKFEDRVFDLRVLVQKNGNGDWVTTAMVARVAPEGSIFPNIAAGGEAVNIETIWQKLYSTAWSESEICKLINEVSIAVAKKLEKTLGSFCEVGLDIGIDKNGHFWIIEANSKPSRKVFSRDQLHLKKLSLKMPMDFAAYSAGFLP